MHSMTWLLLALGIILMTAGADALVNGCAKISAHLKIPAFVVSAIIIGIGANVPEIMLVFMSAGTALEPMIIPHVITGVIINILGIIGISAIVRPIAVESVSRQEIWIMLGSSALMAVMLIDNKLGFIEGAGLLAIFAYYIFSARHMHANHKNLVKTHDGFLATMLLTLGIATLYAGSHLFVDQLHKILMAFNLTGEFIGSLIVAPGTAGPEIIVSVMAIMRRQPSILIGNIVGSCIAHVILIGGVAGLFAQPAGESGAAVLMFLATAIFAIDIWRHKISRWNGVLYLSLLTLYFLTILL
jgi:cation:H+ antiporter